ncbi:MAG: zinc-ribbon domain-containing protein, partial [Clostridium celatum]|nr:zinc-ribbon domain-containing protein [Clostridium celatum]
MADKTIVCRDCGKEFLFTEGEQAFYKEKGFDLSLIHISEPT